MTDAGDYRHRVSIEEPVPKTQPTQYKPWKIAYAKITPTAGSEQFIYLSTLGIASHIIKLRYIEGLTDKHRIIFKGRILNIANVINDGELNIEHIVQAKELQQ